MIPSRREDGHDPKKLSDDSEQDLKSRIGSGIDGPQRDEEIVAAICRGDLEIFSAKEIGRGKIAFGCPFCSRPIEIKQRFEGKEIVCEHCSGKMIAPDISEGNEAVPLSGSEGTAGQSRVELPKPRGVNDEVSGRIESWNDGSANSILIHEVQNRLQKKEAPKFISKEEAESGFDQSSEWKSHLQLSRGKYFHLKRFGVILMIILMLVSTVVLFVKQDKLKSEGHSPPVREQVPDNNNYLVTLQNFSSSKTHQERLQYVRIPDAVNAKMIEAYADLRDGLVLPSIDLETLSEFSVNGLNFCKIRTSVTAVPHYLYFQINEGGDVLLDWESAVGYGEVDVRAFSKWPSDRSVRVRVMARPAQFYAHGYNDRSMDCYALTDLGGKIIMYGYVNSKEEVAELMNGIDFEGNEKWVPCILDLKAPQFSERRRPMQVLIEDVNILGEGWLNP